MSCFQFQEHGECKFGENCRFSHGEQGDNYGAPQGGRGYGSGYGGGRGGYRPRPQRSRGACYTFQETGECQYGDNCRFQHGDQQPQDGGDFNNFRNDGGYRRGPARSAGPCFQFRDQGSCGFGDGCRFSHNLDGDVSAAPAPRRAAGGGICYNFRDNGDCKFGDGCRFSHAEAVDVPSIDAVAEGLGQVQLTEEVQAQ